jgi:hypothetical protein
MDLHVLHGVVLSVNDSRPVRRADLTSLLGDLSFVPAAFKPASGTPLVLSARRYARAPAFPSGGRIVMQTDGLKAIEIDQDVYLTDGESLFHVQPRRGCATAQIGPGFDDHPILQRQRFWAFGLLRLLRHRGLFGLHAAAVATPRGLNLLIVGASGCGKSSLAIALVRGGGSFLSDDAVLLRAGREGIDALAFRRPFSIDAERAKDYPDIVAPSCGSGSRKRRADMMRAYPSQHRQRFRPHVVVFPRLAPRATSTLRGLSRSTALRTLLAQSGPELFDPDTMPAHLDLLARLLRQTRPYELLAGRDLHQAPQGLIDLLQHAAGAS